MWLLFVGYTTFPFLTIFKSGVLLSFGDFMTKNYASVAVSVLKNSRDVVLS